MGYYFSGSRKNSKDFDDAFGIRELSGDKYCA